LAISWWLFGCRQTEELEAAAHRGNRGGLRLGRSGGGVGGLGQGADARRLLGGDGGGKFPRLLCPVDQAVEVGAVRSHRFNFRREFCDLGFHVGDHAVGQALVFFGDWLQFGDPAGAFFGQFLESLFFGQAVVLGGFGGGFCCCFRFAVCVRFASQFGDFVLCSIW